MTSTFTSDGITLFLVVLARVGGLIVSAPVLGDSAVPVRIKAILALLLAFVIAQLPGIASQHVPADLVGFASIVVLQLVFGIALGLVARLMFFAVQTAGEIVSLQMGLSIAAVFNPMTKDTNPVMGQLFAVVAGMTFLALNGDLWLVASLGRSFDLAPLSGRVIGPGLFAQVVDEAVAVTQIGLQIALPITLSVLAATVVLGVISRSLPQLNVFILSLPIDMAIGLAVLAISLGGAVVAIAHLVDVMPQSMLQLTR